MPFSITTDLTRALSGSPARYVPAIEAALVVLLAAQAAQLIWTFAAPSPMPPASRAIRPPADAAPVFSRFDPFSPEEQPISAAAADAALQGLTLFAVRSAGAETASAIIGTSDRQASYAVGDEVAPGLVLGSVELDHVVLRSGGRPLRLAFPAPGAVTVAAAPEAPDAESPPAPVPRPAAGGFGGPGVKGQALLAQAALSPRREGDRVTGFVIQGGGEALQRAGLQRGDIVLSVNGAALNDPGRLAGLREEFATRDQAIIEFERGGQVMTASVPLARP